MLENIQMGLIFSTKLYFRFSYNDFCLGWNSIGYGFYLIEENEFTVNLCV